jgi:hypothetical protein
VSGVPVGLSRRSREGTGSGGARALLDLRRCDRGFRRQLDRRRICTDARRGEWGEVGARVAGRRAASGRADLSGADRSVSCNAARLVGTARHAARDAGHAGGGLGAGQGRGSASSRGTGATSGGARATTAADTRELDRHTNRASGDVSTPTGHELDAYGVVIVGWPGSAAASARNDTASDGPGDSSSHTADSAAGCRVDAADRPAGCCSATCPRADSSGCAAATTACNSGCSSGSTAAVRRGAEHGGCTVRRADACADQSISGE